MPIISRYSCNKCDFELPPGWGGYTYAVDNTGKRVVCPHPVKGRAIREITGLDYAEAHNAGRTGFAQHCVCLKCLKQFSLDLKRDAIICPECFSPQVRSLRELVGQKCPRCKVGIIEEGSSVRWKLDPDWEQLPVPQVVKSLTEFMEKRRVPASLQHAAIIAGTLSEHSFFVIASKLLSWWEGNYFSKDKEQRDSVEMRPQWTWYKALPKILRTTPAQAELIVIRNERCWFSEQVLPDVRRGIKNYIPKHRTHILMTSE